MPVVGGTSIPARGAWPSNAVPTVHETQNKDTLQGTPNQQQRAQAHAKGKGNAIVYKVNQIRARQTIENGGKKSKGRKCKARQDTHG